MLALAGLKAAAPALLDQYWLEKLAGRIDAPEPERVKTQVGDLGGVMALFDKARQHLKSPAVVIGLGGTEVRLSLAGPTARVPGSINVASNAGFGASDWFGRILATGEFEASPRLATPDGLIADLQRFAAEPAKMASEHGKLTGKCCFCNTALTDARSTAVGYGPTCAKKWGGLPFPKASELKNLNLFAA